MNWRISRLFPPQDCGTYRCQVESHTPGKGLFAFIRKLLQRKGRVIGATLYFYRHYRIEWGCP